MQNESNRINRIEWKNNLSGLTTCYATCCGNWHTQLVTMRESERSFRSQKSEVVQKTIKIKSRVEVSKSRKSRKFEVPSSNSNWFLSRTPSPAHAFMTAAFVSDVSHAKDVRSKTWPWSRAVWIEDSKRDVKASISLVMSPSSGLVTLDVASLWTLTSHSHSLTVSPHTVTQSQLLR